MDENPGDRKLRHSPATLFNQGGTLQLSETENPCLKKPPLRPRGGGLAQKVGCLDIRRTLKVADRPSKKKRKPGQAGCDLRTQEAEKSLERNSSNWDVGKKRDSETADS